jgi:hypothetical protein
MDYAELEKLVKEKFGFKKYCFAAVEECGNDSSHEFTVDGELDEFDKEDLKKWEDGEFVKYTNGILLNALCFHEIIEPGDYVIEVFW